MVVAAMEPSNDELVAIKTCANYANDSVHYRENNHRLEEIFLSKVVPAITKSSQFQRCYPLHIPTFQNQTPLQEYTTSLQTQLGGAALLLQLAICIHRLQP